MKRTSFLAVLILAMAAFAGCGDEYVEPDVPIIDIQVDQISPNDTLGDTAVDAARDSVDDEGATCVSGFGFEGEKEDPELGADLKMTTNQTREVPVYYRDCEGNDADRIVTFELIDGEEFCELQTMSAYTDETGLAKGSVKSLEEVGFCHIKACADGLPEDSCVVITVYVDYKEMWPLRVKFDAYNGNYPALQLGTVRLYKKTPEKQWSCNDMDPRDLPAGADIEKAGISIATGIAAFKSLIGLEQELVQDYTIVGMAYEKDSDIMRAWACDDKNGHVEYGGMTTVVLKLYDIQPSIVGTWDIDSNFDLISGLPPTVEKILKIIFGLFESPTGEILMLMCDETQLGMNIGSSLCGYIFADAENPVLGEYGVIGSFVVSIIDQLIINLIDANCPFSDVPGYCKKIWFTVDDVGAILQKFRILSVMKCSTDPRLDWNNPDAGAIINKGDCKEEWYAVVFRWTLGTDCDPADEECGAKYFNMRSIPDLGGTITADISGALLNHTEVDGVTVPGDYLQIDPHAVDLKYGALINFALEKILLPQVFGNSSDGTGLPPVDSYEDLIGSLLAGRQCLTTMSCCSDFDNKLTAKYSWLPAGLAGSACEALLGAGVEYIRSQLNALNGDSGNFLVGTPPDQPAHIIDVDRDMQFDTIGSKMELQNWDANLTIGTSKYNPDGVFWGIRE